MEGDSAATEAEKVCVEYFLISYILFTIKRVRNILFTFPILFYFDSTESLQIS